MQFVRQTEASECGLACLAMVASQHGLNMDLSSLRQRFPLSLTGATLRDLIDVGDELDLSARAIKVELEHLADLQCPAVLHWDLSHFVVLADVKHGRRGLRATIYDPAFGIKQMDEAELSKHFTGVALELTPTANFRPAEARQRVKLSDLWSRISGLKRALLQMLALSVLLQVFALVSPFYLQLVIDEAITRYDQQFLLLLALAFAAVYILSAVTELLRSYVILVLGQHMTFQMAGNVVRHLVRLPTQFFEMRHVGDIISRVGSIKPIQNALTQSVVAALIDGVMAITTAILMLVYSWQLALVVFVFTAIYITMSLGVFPFMRRREEEVITTTAREQSHIMETLRAARAIKLFGGEAQREGAWRNLYSNVVNASIASGKLDNWVAFFRSLLFGLQLVLIVYLGARAILAGQFSVGMLFAFLAYRQNFSERAEGLVTKGLEFRMLGLHLERLSDIVHTEQESGLSTSQPPDRDVKGRIQLDNVSFRYAQNAPFVFSGVNLRIEPGEFIAITGPSGSGKSTLMKVMLGLALPVDGELRVDDLPLKAFGLRPWRQHAGVVMQDDQLLSGTIADNISFFDPQVDMQRIRECADTARIHEDISRMPMNYLSLIGDMGAALSGGQRQRLLLARALYRRPSVLFLDEGTANLDEQSEREIADVIEAMPITRVVVAHRPELIGRADRVFKMAGGVLRQIDAG